MLLNFISICAAEFRPCMAKWYARHVSGHLILLTCVTHLLPCGSQIIPQQIMQLTYISGLLYCVSKQHLIQLLQRSTTRVCKERCCNGRRCISGAIRQICSLKRLLQSSSRHLSCRMSSRNRLRPRSASRYTSFGKGHDSQHE